MSTSILGKIVSFRPFIAKSIYADSDFEYRFRCPRCGSHNAKKAPDSDGTWFLEGNYQCIDCGLTEFPQLDNFGVVESSPITYYSDCFYHSPIKKVIQLSLFSL